MLAIICVIDVHVRTLSERVLMFILHVKVGPFGDDDPDGQIKASCMWDIAETNARLNYLVHPILEQCIRV